MKLPKIIGVILILIMTLSACSIPLANRQAQKNAGVNPDYPITVTDSLGRKVSLNKMPQKVVSLSPAATEIMYAIGCGDKIIGISNETSYPVQVKIKTKVGSYSNIDIDWIESMKPDVVFAGKYIYLNLAKKLQDKGIPVIYAESESYSGIFETIDLMAKIFKANENGKKLAENIKSQVEEIQMDIPQTEKKNVLYVQSLDPFFAAGDKTLINDVINLSGGINSLQDVEGYSQVGKQNLIGKKIDIIVLSSNLQSTPLDYFKTHDLFKDMDAVKNNNIVRVSNEELLTIPGTRITMGVRELAKLIYPEKI